MIRVTLLISLITAFSFLHSAEEKKEIEYDIPALTAEGDALVQSLQTRMDELLTTAEHPLFINHLKSIRAIARIEWEGAKLLINWDPKSAAQVIKFTNVIHKAMQGEAALWETYKTGRRSLVRSFMAHHDRVVSYYTIRLPKDYDENKEYPIYFYLHGHTPAPYMTWMMHWGFRGDKAPENNRDYFDVSIWGRGNSMYQYGGLIDLDYAVLDIEHSFVTDRDRWYLTGHSMGAFGSWAYAQYRPDLFAALGLWAGSDMYAPLGSDLLPNIAHIPARFWHGEKDTSVPVECSLRMDRALRALGGTTSVQINDEAGHMVARSDKADNKKWVMEHTRQRPNPLVFKATNYRYNGAYGIYMQVDGYSAVRPSFRCFIDGQDVHLDTNGTTGVRMYLGERPEIKDQHGWFNGIHYQGMGLSGDVRIFWNGMLAYEGEAKTIDLGDGVDPTFRRVVRAKKAAAEAAKKAAEEAVSEKEEAK